jgi:hypothetical protein
VIKLRVFNPISEKLLLTGKKVIQNVDKLFFNRVLKNVCVQNRTRLITKTFDIFSFFALEEQTRGEKQYR